jgi:uncharacterized membrane protein YesL
MFDRVGDFFVECSQWIWRMMLLNWIWLLHVVMGGVILGVIPATVALFSVTRRWLKGNLEQPIWPAFHRTFKTHFFRVNALGWVYLLVGGVLAFNLYLVSQLQGMVALLCTVAILIGFIIYLFSFLYFFPYYVHFEQTFIGYLIQPFIVALISFKQNLIIAIGLFVLGYLLYQLPGLIPFAVGVLPAYWTMKVSMNRYKNLHWQEPVDKGGVVK